MHIQSTSQMKPNRIVTAEISAVFIDLNSPIVLHVILIGSMFVEDVPMVDIDKPHEAMTSTKDHCHKDWKCPEKTMEIALNSKGQETECEHDYTMTKLVQSRDITFSQGEVVKPR